MPEELYPYTPQFSTFLPPYVMGESAKPQAALPAEVPATGTGDWLTAGVMSGFHSALSEGARALQAGAQLAGSPDKAQAFSDFAEEANRRAQSYARPDLEASPWSPAGIGYNVARMVPMGLAALGGGAAAAYAAPEVAGAGLLGAAGAMFLPAAGANVQRQISETGELTTPGKALALGVPEAIIQGYLPGRLESFFGKGILRGISHAAATQGFAGGASEFLTQQLGDPNRDMADRAAAIGHSALSGAALGTIIGGAFGGVRALVGKPAARVTDEDLGKSVDQALAPPGPPTTEAEQLPLPLPRVPERGELEQYPLFGGRLAEAPAVEPAAAPAAAAALEPAQLGLPLPPTPEGLQELPLFAPREPAPVPAPTQLALPPPEAPTITGGPPPQDMPTAELWTRLAAVQNQLAVNPQDPVAQQTFAILGQEVARRAGETPKAAAPELAAPGVPEPAAPAAPEPAAPVPALNFTARLTESAFKRGMEAFEAASPEAQDVLKSQLIDTILARGDKKLTAGLKKWGKAFDILTPEGELKDEFIPEAPPEVPPGVEPEAPPEVPPAAPPAAPPEAPAAPAAAADLDIPEFLRRGPKPVAVDEPVKTADDRAATLNGVQAEIAKLPDSPGKTQYANEAEAVMKLLPRVENNPGLEPALNARVDRLRAAVEAEAQPPADQTAPPGLAPSPRAEATPAAMGDLDVKLTTAQQALGALRKAVGNRPDAIAALDQHEQWLADTRKAAGPEELRGSLAADPEVDPEGDNLSNLTQLSKPMKAKIDAYLTAQQSVLQELRAQSDSRARVVSSRDGLPVTQLDADVTDMHQRGVPLTDVADHIIEHSADPEQAEIVAKLKDFLPEDGKTGFRDNVVDKEGEYFPKQQTSMLYNAANATTTAIHEMAHAVMHKAIEAGGAAADAVNGIYDQLKSKGDHAGITDAHEMMSEAFANPIYRAFLKSQFVKGTSLWDRIVDTARSVIGLDPRLYNAFDRVMSLGDDLMKEHQQYPNDWVGPDSYARRADDGMGAAANGADDGRDSTVERLKAGIGVSGFNLRNSIRNGALGWTDSYRLGQLYGDAIPSMRPYLEALSKGEARTGALYKASQMAGNMASKLPAEGQELLRKVMADATFYGLDPQKPAPLDIQNTPGRLQLYQELAANWNQLRNIRGGEAAYEALRAKASADYHGVLADRLQTLEKTFPELKASDVFSTFDQRNDIHTNPLKTEAFFKQAVASKVDGLTKYRDQLANQKAAVDATIKTGGVAGDDLKALEKQSSALKANVGDINEVLKEVKDRTDSVAKAPYFHLGRDGDYFVTAKFATNSEGAVDPEKLAKFNEFLDRKGFKDIAVMQGGQHDTLYTRVKTPGEMSELARVVKAAQDQGLLSQEKDSVGAGKATEVFKSIAPEAMRRAVEAMQRPADLEGVDDATTAKMNRAFGDQVADMQRTLLNMMAENSIGRVMARRANVQGFSKDMVGSSNYASQVMSRSLGRMTMAPEVGALIRNMADEVHDLNHTEPGTDRALAASEAVGELMLRDRLKSTYVPPTNLDAVRHLSHTIHVGSSPSYFLMLMSQLATTSWPELAKTHGFAQGSQAMFRALPQTMQVIKAIAKSPDWNTAGITRDALENAGIAPATVNKVMGMVSRGVMGTAMYSTQMTQHSPLEHVISPTVLKAANALGLYSELVPRLVTGFAAHDLYNAKAYPGLTREQFIDRAINDSQGNWDANLNARQTSRGGMFGGMSPLLNQFMGWQIRMTGKIYQEVNDLFDADKRPEATRWLIGHGAATAMFAGTLGLPALTVAASVYDRLMDWVTNRDDHDLTASYRSFLADTFGKDMGEIIARGLPRAVGMDFAHFGEATLIPGSSTINIAFEKRKLEDAERDWFKSMGGAGLGDIANVASMVRDISNGDYLNAMTKFAPKFLKAPFEAYRLGSRGFVNNLNGQTLPISANGYDIALTALGIDPRKQAEYQEVARTESGLRSMRELNSSNIVRHLEQAYMRRDPTMFNTWMGEAQKWQVDHPGMVPPQISFGRELETHIRASAYARGMGLPIGVLPRDVGARGALRYGNIPVQ